MGRKVRGTVLVLALALVVWAAAAVPAFAGGKGQCLNPRGNHYGWVKCAPGCENPRGNHYGWIDCGYGCCQIPRGQIQGWVPCP